RSLVFFNEVMATKPNPCAYLATLKRLKVTRDSCAFVDDAELNVQGARDVGIDAIQLVGAPALANELHNGNAYEQASPRASLAAVGLPSCTCQHHKTHCRFAS